MPSASSLRLSCSKASWSAPSPFGSIISTTSWYWPRAAYTSRPPKASTCMPSSSSKRTRRPRPLNSTAEIWAPSSLRVKYAWPEPGVRRFEISPSTHIMGNPSSSVVLIDAVSSETV